MTTFTPKTYQSQVIDSIAAYFTACHELPEGWDCPFAYMQIS